MGRESSLVDEIMAAVKETPLEFQEHILDVVKTMKLMHESKSKRSSGDMGKSNQ